MRVRFYKILPFVLPYSLLAQKAEFSSVPKSVVEQRLGEYKGKNIDRAASIHKLFEAAGCANDRLAEQRVKHAKTPNVICTLPGLSDAVILVGAHYDRVDAGDGVLDNWSGASLLASLYESLCSRPRQHTFVFVAFTDEEKGLVGSRFFAGQLDNEQRARLKAVINMDTLGASSTKVWLSHADKSLVRSIGLVAAAMHLPLAAVDVDKVGSSDSEAFAGYGIARITIHSTTQENFSLLHSKKDIFSAVRLHDYYDSYRLIAAFLAHLDDSLNATAP